LLGLVNDVSRFVWYFGMAIARSALHIYVSALPFAPSSSHIVKHCLHLFYHTLSLECGQLSHWPALEMMIQSHDGSVCSVAFLPDGHCIALCQGSTGPCARCEQVWFSKVLTKQDLIKVEIKPRRIGFTGRSVQQVSTKDKDPSDRVKSLSACKGSQELGWGNQSLGIQGRVDRIQEVGTGE
jgi:hypothetical protein